LNPSSGTLLVPVTNWMNSARMPLSNSSSTSQSHSITGVFFV
jgi:hypothetical protein